MNTAKVFTAALLLAVTPPVSAAEVILKTVWVDAHKNRVTLQAPVLFKVDKAHKKPNPVGEGAQDGDLHMAGRAPDIGLPLVAEIVNAATKASAKALTDVNALAGTNTNVQLNGVWRVWFEHPSSTTQHQGAVVPIPANTNPDHSFEIHPITLFGDDDLNADFAPIDGYTAHPAEACFNHYESQTFTVTRGATFTSIQAKKAGFNYADFVLVAAGAPKQSEDGGWMVLATIQDTKGKVLVATPRRMVAAPGTAPASAVKALNPGAKLHVIGIPRVNLERLMTEASKAGGQAVTVKGAYEMILVGVE
jgi:hypothetical protein